MAEWEGFRECLVNLLYTKREVGSVQPFLSAEYQLYDVILWMIVQHGLLDYFRASRNAALYDLHLFKITSTISYHDGLFFRTFQGSTGHYKICHAFLAW